MTAARHAAACYSYLMGKRTSKPSRLQTRSAAAFIPFVLGRAAFKKVSAVEGIEVSRLLAADLRKLEKDTPATRRRVLSSKYGKR